MSYYVLIEAKLAANMATLADNQAFQDWVTTYEEYPAITLLDEIATDPEQPVLPPALAE